MSRSIVARSSRLQAAMSCSHRAAESLGGTWDAKERRRKRPAMDARPVTEGHRRGPGVGEEMAADSRGGAQEERKPVWRMELAAEQGHPEATYTLGYIYTVGYFVEKDPERALYHLVGAAELGHWVAQHEAGEAFYRRRDFASAKKYLSMSPFPPCLTLLARMYIQGEGVAQDLHQARLLLQPLVDKGFKDATAYMAVINELDPTRDS